MRTLLLLLCLPAIAPAQGTRTFQTNSGDVIRAELMEVDPDADSVRYRFFAGGGTGITTRRISEFTAHSQFNMRRTTVGDDDIEGHIQLAEFAIDHRLIAAGKRELFKARNIAQDEGIAPELEDRIMEEAVHALDGLLQAMLAEERMKDADYVLHEIMAGPRLTDAQKDYFTELVATKAKEIDDRKAAEREAKRVARLDAERERQIRPLQQRLDRGEQQQQLALKNADSQSTSLRHYDAAIRLFKDLQNRAEVLVSRHSDEPDFVDEVTALSEAAQGEMISCLMSQASIYTTRSSFNQALGKVGEVLAIDSQNQQALNMRARIEIAANSNDGFIGIGRVGGRGRGR